MRRTIAPVLVSDKGRCVCAACSHVSRLSTSQTLWDTLGSSNMIWCWFIAPSKHPMISICFFSMSLAHQSTPSWPCHAKDPHWACPQVTRNVGRTWPYLALPRLLGFPSNDRMEGRSPRDSQCFLKPPIATPFCNMMDLHFLIFQHEGAISCLVSHGMDATGEWRWYLLRRKRQHYSKDPDSWCLCIT